MLACSCCLLGLGLYLPPPSFVGFSRPCLVDASVQSQPPSSQKRLFPRCLRFPVLFFLSSLSHFNLYACMCVRTCVHACMWIGVNVEKYICKSQTKTPGLSLTLYLIWNRVSCSPLCMCQGTRPSVFQGFYCFHRRTGIINVCYHSCFTCALGIRTQVLTLAH